MDDAVLKPGDIVPTTTTAAVIKAIRIATGSDLISRFPVIATDTQVFNYDQIARLKRVFLTYWQKFNKLMQSEYCGNNKKQ